jgi:hypothetical protein
MKISMTERIIAPQERVFGLFADLDGAPGRIAGITKLERLTVGPVGVGTRWRETRVMFGKEATEEMEFTVFEPPRRYVVEAESHGMHYRSEYQFEPAGGATDVHMTFEGRPLTLGAKLMAPLGLLFAGTAKKCFAQDMADLKVAAEAKTEPVATV